MRKNNATMAVFIIPPWYMGELELEAFVKCSKVRGIGRSPTFVITEREYLDRTGGKV